MAAKLKVLRFLPFAVFPLFFIVAAIPAAESMRNTLGSCIFILFFISFLPGPILGRIYAKRRRAGLEALAARLGLTFAPNKYRDILQRHGFLKALKKGDGRYAYNILDGEYREHRIRFFDYCYSVTTEDSEGRSHTKHYHLSVALLRLEKFFPELHIYPESFFSRVGQLLGYESINFESIAFNKAFVVRSSSRRFAYDFCHPRMMECLLRQPYLSLEVERDCLALWDGNLLEPEKIEERFDRLIELRALFPRHFFVEPGATNAWDIMPASPEREPGK